jgi:hypothetical protein
VTFDNLVIDSAAIPEDTQILPVGVTGDGAATGWTASAGSKYQCVDETPEDGDTTYILTSTDAEAYSAALESAASAGISGTVRSVKVMAWIRDVATTDQYKVRLRSGTTNSDSDAYNPGIATYFAISKLFNTNPEGPLWTVNAVDSLEVGVVAVGAVAHRATKLACFVEFDYAASQNATALIATVIAAALGATTSGADAGLYAGGNPHSQRTKRGLGWSK